MSYNTNCSKAKYLLQVFFPHIESGPWAEGLLSFISKSLYNLSIKMYDYYYKKADIFCRSYFDK